MSTKHDEQWLNEPITVCSECLQASCWQGIFMCEKSQNAGTEQMTRRELAQLNREHERFWVSDGDLADGKGSTI